MTETLLEFLGRHRSSNAFIQSAIDRLIAYRPLSTCAKEPAGEALETADAPEQDGSVPWIEPPPKKAKAR